MDQYDVEYRYFDPDMPIGQLLGNLPHWRQEDTLYFVTFRLNDSLPQEKLAAWRDEHKRWLVAHPEPHDIQCREEYYTLFTERFQNWLDAGYGECVLRKPEIKAMVETAIRFFDGDRYRLDEYIVMPNHVHALVAPLEGHSLSEILHSWKSFSSHKMNKMLGASGSRWQKESFDHIVRNSQQLERIREYIRNNPKPRPLR